MTWSKQTQLALVVIILLVFIGIHLEFSSKETRIRDNMLDAVADHDHEDALLYATELLELEPDNNEAKRIINSSGQIFFYLNAAKNLLIEFTAGKDDSSVNPKQLYEQFIKAREYIAKAKQIDSRTKAISRFEASLDEVQTTLIQILSIKLFESGQTIVEKAGVNYRKSLKIVDAADASPYISTFLQYQSAWATVETPIEDIRTQLNPSLDEMDDTGQLIAEYKKGSAKNYTKSLLTYIDTVKKTVDILLTPEGSFDDFFKAASQATSEYKNIRSKLKNATPVSISSKKTLVTLLKKIPDLRISHDSSVVDIISKNKSLYSL